jgi:hypothetical protein
MPIGVRHTQYVAVGAASAGFTNPMQPGQQYLFTANTDCWVKVTVTGGSAAANTADNIMYKASMGPIPLCSPDNNGVTTNSFVKVIRDSADGDACLAILETD